MAHQVDHKGQQAFTSTTRSRACGDSQLGDGRVQDIANYIKRGKLWMPSPHADARSC